MVPWRADDGRAHLVVAHAAPLRAAAVDACVERARLDGYTGIVTSALGPSEQAPFEERGFITQDHLHLLCCTLDGEPSFRSGTEPALRSGTEPALSSGTEPAFRSRTEPAAPTVEVRRVRRRERDDVLALDDAAFPPSWRLGPAGLRDALGATPYRQFRATRARGAVTGYAITGFDGRQGYLQRLATHPDLRRRGLGRALVADALLYAWRRGATRVFVNTQLDNTPALALYASCGFEPMPGGLAVLELAW